MVPVVGPFLLIGVVAWVAAIVMGVGSWFGLWSWRDRWALAGALAGLGTCELYVYAHGGWLPVLVASPQYAFLVTAALFVGSGVGLAYGTLFARAGSARPLLQSGSPEEALWLHDEIDRVEPTGTDWLVTGALLLPSVGLAYLGTTALMGTGLVVAGLASTLGPLWAGMGLWSRRSTARHLRGLLAERTTVEEFTPAERRNMPVLTPAEGETL